MVKYKLIFYTFFLFLQQVFCKKYHNYTLYRGVPVSDDHLNFFQNLSLKYDVNFWREPGLVYKPVDFMISPIDQPALEREAKEYQLYLTTILEDVQQAFDKQTVKSYESRRTETFDWLNYFRINDIYNWLKDLQRTYPKVMKIKSIGRTAENRDILAVKIILQDHTGKRKQPLKKVIIEGGIHAREWVSSAFVTYFINAILHAPFTKNRDLKRIAYLYEWHFVPILNPDGYEYSHTMDRMWRKNRNGYGTDINRNFGYAFGTVGVSFDPTAEIYCGPKAFSEHESIAMARFVKSEAYNLEYFFAFHAYGQYMIIPYADSKSHTDNFDEVKLMGLIAANKLHKRFGTKFTVGTAFDTVGYMTSGISGDWVKRSYGTPVVCTFELRDSGHYGFALPPHQILPACEETTDALVSFLIPRDQGWKERLNKADLLAFNTGHGRSLLEHIVIVCNGILFIIVHFD